MRRYLPVCVILLIISSETLPYAQTLPKAGAAAAINPVPPATSSSLPDPSFARSMSNRALRSIDSLSARIAENEHKLTLARAAVTQASNEVASLSDEKAKVLDELRKGLFCSQCRRSKSQIEKGGEEFYKHLRDVSGHVVPASAEEIAEKAKEFDLKTIEAERHVLEAQKRLQDVAATVERENAEAWDQIQQGMYFWRTAIDVERGLLVAHEDAAQAKDKVDIDAAQAELAGLQQRLARAREPGSSVSTDQISVMEGDQRLWTAVLDRLQSDATKRAQQYWSDMTAIDDRRSEQYAEIGRFVARADGYQRSLAARGASALPLLDFALGPVSIHTKPEYLGVRFDFGKLPGGFKAGFSGVDVTLNDSGSDVRALVSLLGVVELSAGWRTRFRSGQVETGPTNGVVLTPPKDTTPGRPILLPKPRGGGGF